MASKIKICLALSLILIAAGVALPLTGTALPSFYDAPFVPKMTFAVPVMTFFSDPGCIPAGFNVVVFAYDSSGYNSNLWYGQIPTSGGGSLTLYFGDTQPEYVLTMSKTFVVTVYDRSGSLMPYARVFVQSSPDWQDLGYKTCDAQGRVAFQIIDAEATPYATPTGTPFHNPNQTPTPTPTPSYEPTVQPSNTTKSDYTWLTALNVLSVPGIILALSCSIVLLRSKRGK
jgi:hypothetical protein